MGVRNKDQRGQGHCWVYPRCAAGACGLFSMTSGGPVGAGLNLMFGFCRPAGIGCQRSGTGVLRHVWWLKLRTLLTAVVLACLAVSVFL